MDLASKLDKVALEERGEEAKEEDNSKWNMDLGEVYKLALKFYKGDKKFFFADEFLSSLSYSRKIGKGDTFELRRQLEASRSYDASQSRTNVSSEIRATRSV